MSTPASITAPNPDPNTTARSTGDLPYHRLSASSTNQRTFLAALTALAAVQLTILASQAAAHLLPPLPVLGPFTPMAWSIIGVAAALPITLLAVRLIEQRPTGTLSSVAGRIRRRWLTICLLTAAPIVVTGTVTGLLLITLTDTEPRTTASTPPQWAGLAPFLTTVTTMLVFVVAQAAAEEYISRGVLLQAVGRLLGTPWSAIAVQAAVFTALHGTGTPWGTLALITIGSTLGWITIRTGGLEAAIAIHLTVNLPPFLASAAFPHLADPTANTADTTWQAAATQATTVLIYAATIHGLAATRPIAALLTPRKPR
ncbi:lysostaphin resistance A-like protein [Micromonospora sp. SH-82]|uniref:CPBP family intramembrane glutamic endopeptidase n=1 Tax=Micromonospora sp. SH-82 TaxID=3132938 RepID=UPI003EBBE711